jgi:outer membrane protein OmpA-like peptidoglycan-associated protein
MKYKVTTRGWVVFSILGIFVIALLVSMFNNPTSDELNTNSNVESTSQIEDASNSDNDEEDGAISENNTDNEDTSDQALIDYESSEAAETDEPSETDTSSEAAVEDEIETEQIVDYNKETIILFDKNISELEETYLDEINEWIMILKDNNMTITVEGHINGYPYYNDGDFGLSLAENRANIIKGFMVEQGIEDKRILIVNMGSNKQANKTDNFYLNRRAIIYFNEKP